jgi:hypothetical protein
MESKAVPCQDVLKPPIPVAEGWYFFAYLDSVGHHPFNNAVKPVGFVSSCACPSNQTLGAFLLHQQSHEAASRRQKVPQIGLY